MMPRRGRHVRGDKPQVPEEQFANKVKWPPPSVEPEHEHSDRHDTMPLDNDEDGIYLEPDDPRRIEIELRRGWRFDER
jgi:hypothetical protein